MLSLIINTISEVDIYNAKFNRINILGGRKYQ